MSDSILPVWLHISAAAREAGVCEETLRNWVRRGDIPDRRDSANRRYFTKTDINTVRRGKK